MRRLALLLLMLLTTAPALAQPAADSTDTSAGAPSRFGILTSRRWRVGRPYVRENLTPVANPNPAPEPHPIRAHPYDVAVSGDGRRVYVALQGTEINPGDALAVYDVATDCITKRIALKPSTQHGPAASSPYRLAMMADGRHLIATSRFSNFASVIDTRTDTVVSEIPTDFYCQGMAVTPDGKTAYVANRYLDQVFVVDLANGGGRMRELGGFDETTFRHDVYPVLRRTCATAGCHDVERGGFVASSDAHATFCSVLRHVRAGSAASSRLLRAVVRSRDGGYADVNPKYLGHANGRVVFIDPSADKDYQAIARWIDQTREGPGIAIGNPQSKPKVLALSSDGRLLFVGNTGTQDIAVVDTASLREVGSIYVQNVVNDLHVFHSPENGHDYLIATTQGIGFGVVGERDPWGGESWDRNNPAAQFSVWRDLQTSQNLPRDQQDVLGPFDAVDGTAAIKFRDIQNDLLVVDVSRLKIPPAPPKPDAPLPRLLMANRYEAHRGWVRYTSDSAESTHGDVRGDVPPDLMRVVGAMPEKIAMRGDRLFVTMQGTNEVQELRIDPLAADPSDLLIPVAVYPTGMQPIGIAAGSPDTPAAGKLFVASNLSGTLSVIDGGKSHEVTVDPTIDRFPMPATNAERGEMFAHTATFSSDHDSACVSCHYLDMGDGRPWGVSQVVGQHFPKEGGDGQLIIGGTMGTPQMRNLFVTQPFFLEGTLSAFEPRSMMQEHAPPDDFAFDTPQGDFTAIHAHRPAQGRPDLQSQMVASTKRDADLDERRDELFRRLSMQQCGKAFVMRDFQRFIGEWQVNEPRLLPNPFDPDNPSVKRGEKLFSTPQVGCVSCHPPPSFTRKTFPDNPQQSMPPLVPLTVRDAAFTLIGMNRLDFINDFKRDLEPWDAGREETQQGHFTTFPLRGLWDRPPVLLHNGGARSLREVVCTPGHAGLRTFKYVPLLGGFPERPGGREIGFNATWLTMKMLDPMKAHVRAGGRIGIDTHGGTSQLRGADVDDIIDFITAIP